MSAVPAVSPKTGALNRVWFPLRSNVGYFDAAGLSLDLEARIKETALLSEELLFEFGMLDVTVTEGGMWSSWTPPHQLSEEDIVSRRDAAEKGGPVSLSIGPESSPGVPAEPSVMHTVFAGAQQRAFVAEYHLLLRDSGLEDVSWVKWAVPPAEAILEAKAIAQRQNSAELIGSGYSKLPHISDNRFLDNHLKKDLNFDLAVGGLIGTPVAVDELRRPVLQYKASAGNAHHRAERTPGLLALYALAPDFTELPWADIIALHDDDAIGAFRAKMVQFEQEVAHRPEGERERAIKDLGFDEAIVRTLQRLGSSKKIAGEVVAEVAVDLAVGSLPLLSQAASVTKGIAKAQKARSDRQNEWTAVLMALRRRQTGP